MKITPAASFPQENKSWTSATRILVLNGQGTSLLSSNRITHQGIRPYRRPSRGVLSQALTCRCPLKRFLEWSQSLPSFEKLPKQRIHDLWKTLHVQHHRWTITLRASKSRSPGTAQLDAVLNRRRVFVRWANRPNSLILRTATNPNIDHVNRSHCLLLACCDNLLTRRIDVRR